MDFIGTLAGTLGVDSKKAEAVAGALLGAAKAEAPAEEGAKLDSAVPELGGWMATAKQMMGAAAPAAPAASAASSGGGLLGGLMQAAGSGIGNDLLGAIAGKQAQQTASAVALLGQLGLDTSKAALAAPVILDFLKSRLGEEWTDRLLQAAPMLAGLVQQKAEGSPSKGLFGLF